jgi:hypothetical protein
LIARVGEDRLSTRPLQLQIPAVGTLDSEAASRGFEDMDAGCRQWQSRWPDSDDDFGPPNQPRLVAGARVQLQGSGGEPIFADAGDQWRDWLESTGSASPSSQNSQVPRRLRC